MNKNPLGQLTASKLRLILLGSAVILVLASAGLIILGQQAVSSYGKEVSSTVAVSSSDEKTLQDLEIVSRALASQKPIVDKSKLIIADKNNTYTYQKQVIQDITRYADMAGVQVVGFTFAETGGVTTGAPATAAASTPAAGTKAGGIATPAGVTPVNVTVALGGDVSYDTLYKLLQLLEGNLLRMEIESLDLSRPSGTEASAISSLTIRIYTQK